MTAWRGILAVAGFQLRRLLAPQRLLLAAVGAAFPAAVMLAVRQDRRRASTAISRWCCSTR